MTGTDLCVNKPHKSRSYLNHLVFTYTVLRSLFISKFFCRQRMLISSSASNLCVSVMFVSEQVGSYLRNIMPPMLRTYLFSGSSTLG